MRPLCEIVKIIKGNKAEEVFTKQQEGSFRYIQIEDLRPNSKIKYAIDKSGTLAQETDVLIAWDGANAGTVGFGLEGYIGSTLAILRPLKNNVYTPYLGYYLQSKFSEIQKNTTGATIPHVSRNNIENILVPLPPLPEQQRIAAILQKADRLRRLRQYARQLSDGYLQSVFLEMFGDPATNPKGWEKEEFEKAVLGTQNGFSPRNNFSPQGSIVLRIRDISSGRIDYSDPRRMIIPENVMRKYILEQNDLLLVRVNGNPNYVGMASEFKVQAEPILFSDHIIRVKTDKKIINTTFLTHLLNSPFGRKQTLSNISTTAGQFTINSDGLSRIKIFFPPLSEQEKFAKLVEKYEGLKNKQMESERQSDHLFQSLLQRAFQGEL